MGRSGATFQQVLANVVDWLQHIERVSGFE